MSLWTGIAARTYTRCSIVRCFNTRQVHNDLAAAASQVRPAPAVPLAFCSAGTMVQRRPPSPSLPCCPEEMEALPRHPSSPQRSCDDEIAAAVGHFFFVFAVQTL